MRQAVLTASIGFLSGVLSGAFGIGGGLLTTPAIRLLLGAPALVAVGTPLPVIVPTALTGAWQYLRSGTAEWRPGVIVGLAGIVTSVLGALLTVRVGGSVVLIGTAALMLYAAVDTLSQLVRPVTARPDAGTGMSVVRGGSSETVPLVIAGLLTGIYSGFFGLGGGFVLVPVLTRWLRYPVKRAIGTSLLAVAVIAVPGTVSHALLGNVDWAIAAGLIVGVVPGAMFGARMTLGSADRAVRGGFVALLVLAGALLAWTELASVM